MCTIEIKYWKFTEPTHPLHQLSQCQFLLVFHTNIKTGHLRYIRVGVSSKYKIRLCLTAFLGLAENLLNNPRMLYKSTIKNCPFWGSGVTVPEPLQPSGIGPQLLEPIYTERQHQCRVNAAVTQQILVSLTTM